jgi:hypothetical protein
MARTWLVLTALAYMLLSLLLLAESAWGPVIPVLAGMVWAG